MYGCAYKAWKYRRMAKTGLTMKEKRRQQVKLKGRRCKSRRGKR